MPDRERRPVTGPSKNSNGAGPRRLTPEETRERLQRDGAPLFTVVDANGQPVRDWIGLPVTAPTPATPPLVTLPVSCTATEMEIRAEGEATAFSIQLGYQEQRRDLERRIAGERATLLTCRARKTRAEQDLEWEMAEREAFLNGLPRRCRRRLRRKSGRLLRLVPWAVWLADTLVISRAWALLGPLPLPFHASVSVTNVTQVLRAALVSFGLVFGARLVGGKLRELADELRERWNLLGMAFDAGVGALVLAGAVKLALATAQMQEALLRIEAGGTSVHLPTSVLFSIVAFLVSVSLAAGYYLNEPAPEQAEDHDRRVTEAKAAADEATDAAAHQLGVVRATREELNSLEEEETLALAENEAHTDRHAHAHRAGNPLIYGLEFASAGQGTGGSRP
jgi:hypothetical protein